MNGAFGRQQISVVAMTTLCVGSLGASIDARLPAPPVVFTTWTSGLLLFTGAIGVGLLWIGRQRMAAFVGAMTAPIVFVAYCRYWSTSFTRPDHPVHLPWYVSTIVCSMLMSLIALHADGVCYELPD